MDVNAYATHRLLAAEADRLAENAERIRIARERAEADAAARASLPAAAADSAGSQRSGRLSRRLRVRPAVAVPHAQR